MHRTLSILNAQDIEHLKHVFNPDRLRGRDRARVIGHYLAGRFTASEAARAIGVHICTVLRAAPAGFDWDAVRRAYVDKLMRRVTALRGLDRIGD
jgi:hypothetical protein